MKKLVSVGKGAARKLLHARILLLTAVLRGEIAAWQTKRNEAAAKIHWTFTIAVARQKLRKLYPDWKGVKEIQEKTAE